MTTASDAGADLGPVRLSNRVAMMPHALVFGGGYGTKVPMGITFIARMAMWGAMFGGSDDEDGGGFGLLIGV